MACICGVPVVLYWIDDAVWRRISHHATASGGHLCVVCAERYLGRSLSLADLSIDNYLRTTDRNSFEFMRQYVRSTILGACRVIGNDIPNGWTMPTKMPHTDAVQVGEDLARNTRNCREEIDRLISDAVRCFP
jgi:hypothetical protein